MLGHARSVDEYLVATEVCEHCTKGIVIKPNGARLICPYCKGDWELKRRNA